MIQNMLSALLAFATPPGGQQQAPPLWTQLVPFALLILVFYFALIRPQQKKAKDHANLLQGLRKGDKITTSSGIVGVVVSVKEKTVTLRSDDTKLEILKSAVSEITERANDSSESNS